ncbi:pentatricopeptide repeat-containing protein At3g12770-like isoform X2 [Syzygium oleosum]|uniref:pentatricopeptide repeat-containing protein At3g12770-like isoform X2 n=1 Tax=Syzygium oleosum TaxID=219896 RepID=UPI0024B8C9A0|nr:pentatricopeptide repeat-containing protein At3g12770-like isoform X2 [Syzygium oleosum]
MISFSGRETFRNTTFRCCSKAALADSPCSASTLLHFIQLCAEDRSLRLTRQSHARVLVNGFARNTYLGTKLMSAYAACRSVRDSRLVFDSFEDKNVYLWNTLINGYAKSRAYEVAFELFDQMCLGNVVPDDYTLATLSKAAGECGDLAAGKVVHAKSARIGFVSDVVVANSLMSMYCKCGELDEAKKLFDEMPDRSIASWNVLITGYASLNDDNKGTEVWDVVQNMLNIGLKPDAFTVSSLLPLCIGDSEKYNHGKELHGYMLRNELELLPDADVHLGCCLIDMYSKNNKADAGRRVFERVKSKNVFSWTAMINGYVIFGDSEGALSLFREMMVMHDIEPNDISLVSILPACVTRAGLSAVREIHSFAIRKKIDHGVSFSNALIDAYCKSGGLISARRIFDAASFKDAVSWSSMISGYGLHGKGEEAVLLYNEMLHLRIKPDMITVVGVLAACGRSGMVSEGLNIYSSAINDYGIEPTVEICACVVDILGRSNQLDRALQFIGNMHVEAGPSVWGALVNASVMHGNHEMRDLAYSFLVRMEPENPSNYVFLSNLYASSRKWDVVAGVRKMMHEKGFRKEPGCSWIVINGRTNCFYVADKRMPAQYCYLGQDKSSPSTREVAWRKE